MDRLLRGVSAFRRDVFPQRRALFEQLASAQHPHSLVITCADSRIVPQMVVQSDPGDLFICRNAGNMVPPYGEVHGGVSATIEYAVEVLNVEDIVVCGHTDCGAMKGVLYPDKVAQLPTVARWLQHGHRARRVVLEKHRDGSEAELLAALTEENVLAQLDNLRTHPSVAARLATGRLALHGWVYEIHTGAVRAWQPDEKRFLDFGAVGHDDTALPAVAE